jgi:tetratricopeptide (TPR) repeat protein
LIGLMHLDLGNYEQGRKYLQSYYDTILAISTAHNEDSQAMFNFCLGLVDIKEGKLDAAKAKSDTLESLLPKITPANKEYIAFIHSLLLGEILLAADSADRAIKTLESVPSLGTPPPMQTILLSNIPFLQDALARAYEKNGETDEAVREYERLMAISPRQGLWTWIHPLYHFRLAKLYEKKGSRDQAVSQYQKFLDIWKNADPDIPEIAEAKKRLETLR